MITAMTAGPTVHRILAIVTVALVFASSPAQAQQWEDSDVGAPAQNTGPEPADAPAAAPAPEAAGDQYIDTDPSALTDFRPALDPHGRWINDPTYGVVWVPNEREVGRDFAPYVTNGHWAQTAEGDWIWVSNYRFGWVVFHYGRWVWITGTGWAWIPGRQYAPAWVVWRVPSSDYAYVGWAPMPPNYVWVDGAAVTLWFTAPAPYVFCHSHYIFDYHVHHHIIHDHHHVTYIAGRTRVYRPISRGGRWRANPTVTEARVPSGSIPRGRTPADPRAVAASRRQASARTSVGPAAAPARRFSTSRSLGTNYSASPASGGYGRSTASRPASAYSASRPAWGARAPAATAPPARFAPTTPSAAPSRPRTFVAPSAPAARARPSASAPPARLSVPSTSSGSSSSAPRSSWSSSSGSAAPRSSWSSSPRSSWSSSPRSSWSSSPRGSSMGGGRSAPARIRR